MNYSKEKAGHNKAYYTNRKGRRRKGKTIIQTNKYGTKKFIHK